jgi:CRP-like cAMP-binding protein
MAKEKRAKDASAVEKVLTGHGTGQSRERYASFHNIYAQGDAADACFYIESGRVNISSVSPDGKEAVVAIRREGEFFGTRCLVGQRMGSAMALTDCSVIRVTTSALTQLLREEPDFAVAFAIHLVRQSIGDQENLVDHLTNPAEKRLARVLLQLAQDRSGDGSHAIPASLSQILLANMVGTTRSRINYFMNNFKRQGFIDYDRQGRVKVRDALRKAMSQD